ncbi:MAG TPA: hypothetical protein DCX07_06970 [Phycisphaerales bacterium]|nr:hypothetical protein [Phycisphaerales bacterium]
MEPTRVCEWCAEPIARKAVLCPRCHKWRKDIARIQQLVRYGQIAFGVFAVIGFLVFLIEFRQGIWHEKIWMTADMWGHKTFVPDYTLRFSGDKFIRSLAGWQVISAGMLSVVGLALAVVGSICWKRKTGS